MNDLPSTFKRHFIIPPLLDGSGVARRLCLRACWLRAGIACALVLTTLAGCQKNSSPGAEGRAYFKSLNCQACHRVGEEGGRGGPDLTLVGFRQSPEWLDTWLKDPQAWKKDALMPNPRLSEKARKAMVEYLATLKGPFEKSPPWDSPELRSDPVKRGRAIYSRTGCVACHGPGGAGGFPNNNVPGGLVPALNNVAETFTREELKIKIRRGVKPQKADPGGPEPLVAMPAWGQVLKEEELDALASYLFSLKSKAQADTAW